MTEPPDSLAYYHLEPHPTPAIYSFRNAEASSGNCATITLHVTRRLEVEPQSSYINTQEMAASSSWLHPKALGLVVNCPFLEGFGVTMCGDSSEFLLIRVSMVPVVLRFLVLSVTLSPISKANVR